MKGRQIGRRRMGGKEDGGRGGRRMGGGSGVGEGGRSKAIEGKRKRKGMKDVNQHHAI